MLKPSPNHGTLRLPNDDDDLASIGKLYGDGGNMSILVDSDVYAPASARLRLEWKQRYETHPRVPVSTVARSISDMNATK